MRGSVVLVALLGCRGGTPAPAPVANQVVQAPPPAPLHHAKCTGELRPHRETMLKGQRTELAAFGKQGTYKGSQHDHFDDGTSAMLVVLEIFGEPWMPDVRDRSYHAFGDHCVRLASATEDKVELDVAIQPDHAYDPGRCHMGCCVTEAQQKLGPNGEQECCFCDDDPTP